MEKLIEQSQKSITNTNLDFQRYLHSTINWESRMIGLTGARGVGKTTLILQHIKNKLPINKTLYITVEDFYFSTHRLVELADDFVKLGGQYLFIDEIHKYKDWSQELKLLYDYHPQLKIVFTGSSVLDINKGAADLSRRAVMYQLKGLSFREYLHMFHQIKSPVYTLEAIVGHQVSIPELRHPLLYFQDYLRKGYYPFAMEDEFDKRLQQIIHQIVESDIPLYADMNVSTGRKLKQLLAIISQSVPFKPNYSSIASMLGASRNNISDYLVYLEDAQLIAQLRTATGGIRGLGKVDKVYLDNTNLIYALAENGSNIGNIRETFFFNQTKALYEVLVSPAADFIIKNLTFEIGGKHKGQKQIQGTADSYVVKDDIEFGFMNIIPLWQFGLLY